GNSTTWSLCWELRGPFWWRYYRRFAAGRTWLCRYLTDCRCGERTFRYEPSLGFIFEHGDDNVSSPEWQCVNVGDLFCKDCCDESDCCGQIHGADTPKTKCQEHNEDNVDETVCHHTDLR